MTDDLAWGVYNFINEWKAGNHGEVCLQEALDRDFSETDFEEPVSEDLQEASKQCKMSNIDFEQELYNHFGQVKDFSCGMRIARYFYEMGRKHQMDGVWHEPSEKPKGDYTKELLVFTKSGYCRVVCYSIRLWNNISKWAYLEDILPT